MMRLVLMYDLPSTTAPARRIYTFFHNFLLKNNFYMLQESVYCCFVRSYHSGQIVMRRIQANAPRVGDVRCLMITEKQYQDIVFFTGQPQFHEAFYKIDTVLEI